MTQKQLLPNISAGLIIGMLQVFLALSFAALIFSGDLSGYVARGVGLALIGAVITGLVIAVFTSLRGTVGGVQSVPAAIMTVMAAAITAEMPVDGSDSAQGFITVVAAIAVATFATGLGFWVLGRFRLGGLARFLPYPVVGGFLAGTGWLLVIGAIGMMVDAPLSFDDLSFLLQPQVLVRWLPGLLLALIMITATRRSDNFLILPALLAGALLLFFAAALIGGISLAELSAGGWLLGPFPQGTVLWRPLTPAMLSAVNWTAVAGQTANIVAIMAVSAISLLLNAGGLELATDRNLEVNHELRIVGAANMLAGLAAGLVGYKQLSLSTLNFKMGGSSRLPGLIAAGLSFLVLIAGAAILSFSPKVVIGSLLLFLGLGFLFEWVVEGWFRLPKIDYAIVLVILFVTVVAGFLEAVALGLLLAVILFVVSYSQVEVVRHELSGESYQSRMTRARQHDRLLAQQGERMYILQLQGFIFFGTANNLLNQMRERVNDPDQEKPRFIVLDFLRVTGLDSTGMLSFTRMKQLAENEGITLVFTQPNERVLYQLQRGDLGDDGRVVRIYHSLDQGVEACENHLLAAADVDADPLPLSLAHHLQDIMLPGADAQEQEAQIQILLSHMERVEVAAGDRLIAMGDEPDDLYFVESGLVTAQLNRPGRAAVRLETTGSGSVIGEIGFYLGQERTADVMADTPGVVYRMSLEDLKQLEETDPEAATMLHQIVVQLLAERVTRLTNTVKALER